MKKQSLTLCFVGVMTLASRGGFYYSATSGTIPDGNPAGWAATVDVSGLGLISASSVMVDLNISGGYNGDLYAYLSYGGVLVPLLNRVGVGTGGTRTAFGYSDAGMSIRLTDSGASNIHFYQEPTGSITGGATWQPDGRAISPLSPAADFDASGTIGFSAFDGKDPNGTWTIFFADLSSGDQSHLDSWSLSINGVPEPVNVALGIFGGLFSVVALARSKRVRDWAHRRRATVVEWINAV